jgi:hypothetical protein
MRGPYGHYYLRELRLPDEGAFLVSFHNPNRRSNAVDFTIAMATSFAKRDGGECAKRIAKPSLGLGS